MPEAPKAMPIYPGLIGKVALVAGASSGIGAETARYLAANMVTVVCERQKSREAESKRSSSEELIS